MSLLDFDPKHLKIWKAEDLLDLQVPEGYYLIEPKLLPRGGKFLLGGGPKIGKTFVVLAIIKAMLQGSPLFGKDSWFVRPAKTLLIEREIGPYSLAERIRDVFGEELRGIGDRFTVLSRPKEFSLSSPACVKWLKAYCKLEGIDLLLLDPVNKLWHGNENDNSEMLRLVDSLEDLQDGTVGLVASHHFGKPVRGQGVDKWDSLDSSNFRGATRLVDDADTILTIQRMKGVLSPAWESWKMRCRLMVRHSGAPQDFLLHFNEGNDRKMVYHTEASDRASAKKPLQFPGPTDPFAAT